MCIHLFTEAQIKAAKVTVWPDSSSWMMYSAIDILRFYVYKLTDKSLHDEDLMDFNYNFYFSKGTLE